MAASIGSLALKLTANATGLLAGLDHVAAKMRSFAGTIGGVVGGLGQIGLATQGVQAIWGGLQEVFGRPLMLAAELEQTTVALETMLGSADKAKGMIKDIQNFAATTPFESPELFAAGKQLLAMGIGSEKIVPTLRALGDVASGLSQPIGEIAYLFGQVKSQGRLMGDDLRQFASRGIPIIAELAKVLNTSETNVKDLVSQGKVGFNEVAKAFQGMVNEGGKFVGMTQKQSQTISGLWSTLKDNIGLTLTEIGKAMIEGFSLKGIVTGFIDFTETIRSNVASVVIPLFSAIGDAGKGAWAVLQRAWLELGQPVFDRLTGWLGTTGDYFKGWRGIAVNVIEKVALSINGLVNGLKIAAGAFLQYFAAPMIGAFANMAQSVADLLAAVKEMPEWLVGPDAKNINPAGFGKVADQLRDMERSVGFKGSVLSFTPFNAGDRKITAFFRRVRDGLEESAADGFFAGIIKAASAAKSAVVDLTDPAAVAMGGKGEVKLGGALERGSKAAEEAIARFQVQRDRNPVEQQQLAVQQKILATEEKSSKGIDDIEIAIRAVAALRVAVF